MMHRSQNFFHLFFPESTTPMIPLPSVKAAGQLNPVVSCRCLVLLGSQRDPSSLYGFAGCMGVALMATGHQTVCDTCPVLSGPQGKHYRVPP